MSSGATLVADGGDSAVENDFFRSAEFFAAEQVTHTLWIKFGGRELRVPLKVESIDGGLAQDATSPYGYPGLSGTVDAPLDPATVDFSETGLVSIFLRHRLGEAPLLGATERNHVYVSDPAEARKTRPQDRHQVAMNIECGCRTEILDGPEVPAADRAAFIAAYTQTMTRKGAARRYFLPQRYFDQVLDSSQSRLVITRERDDTVAAASIAVLSDGFIHYYFSASTDTHQLEAPSKNLVTALVDWSYEADLPLNLGGGLKDDDTLAMFKRGFANRTLRLHTSEIVCDEKAYAKLAGPPSPDDFFPAYRSPKPPGADGREH